MFRVIFAASVVNTCLHVVCFTGIMLLADGCSQFHGMETRKQCEYDGHNRLRKDSGILKRIRFILTIFACALLLTVAGAQETTDDTLHVPSPDWRDQIIYFIMIDRFNDGDPSNNDQGAGEYDPEDERKFQGGDLQGIIDQLDYIEGLGATTVWITPPVENQWWDPLVNYGGYHGYWASDFTALDPHFGTLETYQALSRALHSRDMYLIQDIVTNHTGNFYSYDGRYNPDDPTENFILNTESVPTSAPVPPLNQNDITDPADRESALYHWTPNITDYDDTDTREVYQLADLDDLNTSNPVVRDLMRSAYGDWIREAGVDGFRVDTVIYVEHDFWNDFLHSTDATAPGMYTVAAATGRDDFLTFGEAYRTDDPFTDDADREVHSYLGTDEQPEFSSMIQFPLFATLDHVFAAGAPTDELSYRLGVINELYAEPSLLPTFIDNHDVERFLNRNGEPALRQALAFLLTSPGIPVIYYGTEQGFVESRPSMFAEGVGSDGEDHFDTEAPLYRWIADLSELRTNNPALTRGTLEVLADDSDSAGVFVYQRTYEGESVVVVMNTADEARLAPTVSFKGLGTIWLEPMLSTHEAIPLHVDTNAAIPLALRPREATVYRVLESAKPPAFPLGITVDALPDETITGDVTLTGTTNTPNVPLLLVLNERLADAIPFVTDADGAWTVTLPADALPVGEQNNTLHIYAPEAGQVSAPVTFTSDVQLTATGETRTVSDPAGDDNGLTGDYAYPTDETFTTQMDILAATVAPDGADLAVTLTMSDLTDVWTPANGFDHVLFSIFVDVPESDGVTVLPRLNASAPDGFAWDAFAFVEGWTNRIYTSDGASESAYGTTSPLETSITVNPEAATVTITIPGAALGNPRDYDDVAVYITTWDWNGVDGNYRGLAAEPSQWNMSGGDGDTDPLIMDDILIPAAE